MRLPKQTSLHHVRRGHGRPLLLVHGLGGSTRSWETIADALAAERELVIVDLPGFGRTPPLNGAPTIAALTDALEGFLAEQSLEGVDVVGSSMGARLALELARRRSVGAVVALDPGGFWNAREVRVFEISVGLSIRLVKLLAPLLPLLSANPVTRTLLLAQFSARPWALPADVVLNELRSFAASPVILQTLRELAHGPLQEGLPKGSCSRPIVLGWGRRDRVTFSRQAKRAQQRFPDARLHWFEHSGHFPHWDEPAATARLILDRTQLS
ncbi:MAG: alpha/beta hydrolase [Solirubrobacteraceae bacterium]